MSAVKWSRSLLHALVKMADVTALTHTIERAWPKGQTLWGSANSNLYDSSIKTVPFGYPALLYVGDWWLKRAYGSAARRLFDQRRIDAVVCYNCMQPYHQEVLRAAAEYGIPAVPIILDGRDPREDNWRQILRQTEDAAGVALLSYWMYKHWPRKQSLLHLDGGADAWMGGETLRPRLDGPYRLVYTGALAKWSGALFLKNVIRQCKRNDVRFIICGKVEPGEADQLTADERVELRGFVSEKEFQEICKSADAFLNVRDPSVGDNVLNYPSKLPRYLSYGKPVISNHLVSLSPDYDRFLLVARNNTVAEFEEQIERALACSVSERVALFGTIKEWFCEKKLWRVQAGRLVEWLEQLRHDKSKEGR